MALGGFKVDRSLHGGRKKTGFRFAHLNRTIGRNPQILNGNLPQSKRDEKANLDGRSKIAEIVL
ncbi:MAG: hypothetical protein COV67_13140 [Nitrospinae bacterium CG11_big_fil_rev_8_21_14_0_20_56_8]|nr:MAG: hypothetical protein COV67_13140 [Nitrospinae bacterium CG11_big_fil_rev_8_21_14_0_20_56_8]